MEPEEPNADTESSLVLMSEEPKEVENPYIKEEKPELTEAQKLSIKKINDYLNEQELVRLIFIAREKYLRENLAHGAEKF